jgi:hypothetical protein
VRPVDRILRRLDGIRRNGSSYEARCPVVAHGKGRGDRNPSLSVSEGEDGRALVYCHAGCDTAEILSALGLETADLFDHRNGSRRGKGESVPSTEVRYVDRGCTVEDYARAKRLPVEFLTKVAHLSDMYYVDGPAVRMPYLDESGEQVCTRFRVSLTEKPKVKTKSGDKHALYGLWLLERIKKAGMVVLVEGESDCHTLWYHGVPVLGIPGASSWKSEWTRKFDGLERIYVVVEPDAAGEGLWEKLVASPLKERLYRVALAGHKDPSELHLDAPERFRARFEDALAGATSFMDIAETEAQERRREAWVMCETLAREDDILSRFAEDLRDCGVAGESRTARLLYLALNSRHLPEKQLVNVVVKGPSSAGKSHLVESVLRFFPEEAYHMLTAMSERALAYSEEPLSHRFLVLAEAAGMSGEFQTYLVRSLLSEGRLRYETVEKTSEGPRPRLIEREGPTGLIVTTTRLKLHGENETRMLAVRVDDSPSHTKAILAALADEDRRSPDLSAWRALQEWISGGETRVTIPFSKDLAAKTPAVAVRLRRDFRAVLSLIRSHALLHRENRERDTQGRIVATLEDYGAVRDLIFDLLSEGVGATVPKIVRETVEAVREIVAESDGRPTNIRRVGAALDLDYSATHRRVGMALEAGYLNNLEDRKGKPAQLVIGNDLPDDREILPTVEALREVVLG